MARPLRRVCIGLSIRLGISVRELEALDIATIRQYLAMLGEINKPSCPAPVRRQTPEEIQSVFMSAFGKEKH